MELAPARGRRKVKLGPGFSQMDWMKLTQMSKQLGAQGGPKAMTLAEVREHNNLAMDAWMVIRGKVYNVTKYGPYHPGGLAELARAVGDDGTTLFDEVHPWVSIGMLDKCIVGWIVQDDGSDAGAAGAASAAGGSAAAAKPGGILARMGLRPTKKTTASNVRSADGWVPCELAASAPVPGCRHCALVRVESDSLSEEQRNLLQVPGTIVKLRRKLDKIVVERPFTPFLAGAPGQGVLDKSIEALLGPRGDGRVDLLVKAYKDGQMSVLLATAEPGLHLEMLVQRSAWGLALADSSLRVEIFGAAAFRKAQGSSVDHVCMIAAGTGVMPMLQVVDFVARERAAGSLARNAPSLSLLVANRTEEDAAFMQELESAASGDAALLARVSHVLSKPIDPSAWQGRTGHVDAGVVAAHLDGVYAVEPAAESSKTPAIRFLVCGSYEFNLAVEAVLVQAGWPGAAVFRID